MPEKENAVMTTHPDRNRIARYYFILCIPIMMTHFRNTDIFCTNRILWSEAIQAFIAERIGAPLVAGFFLVSGFLFFKAFTITELLSKWKRRIRSLLIPYLLWNLIYALYAYIMANSAFLNRFADEKSMTLPEFFRNILIPDYCNPVFWYMKYLIVFVIAAPVIYYALKNLWIGLITLILLIVYNCGALLTLPGDINKMAFWLTFFVLGAYYGLHFDIGFFRKLREDSLKWPKTAIAVLMYTVGLIYVLRSDRAAVLLFYDFSIAFLFWNITGLLEFKLSPIMRCTFFLYAAHWLIARNFNKLICVIFYTDGIYGLIAYILLPFVVLGLAGIIRRLLSEKGLWLWNLLSGGRS